MKKYNRLICLLLLIIFFPNPAWSASNSFDYKQYYDKKKGLRTFSTRKKYERASSM